MNGVQVTGGWAVAPGSIAKVMDRCRALQRQNIGLVVFPEGTRSKTGRLQPFKDGFFRFSIETGCEILPCVLHNSASLMPLNSSLLDAGTAYFAFGDPIMPLEAETVTELKARVKKEMLKLLALCPTFDATTETPLEVQASTREHGW